MVYEIAVWLIIIEILSLIALPISYNFFKNLKDKGYLASKALGLLLFSYFTWIISHIAFGLTSIIASLILLIGISYYYYKKNKPKFDKNYIKRTEILFITIFLFLVIVRSSFPAIEGLEKFSDFSIINGILRSDVSPPIDSWLSGNTMNYYYFGHFMIAVLTKLSLIGSNITFNLGLATIFALAAILAFSIGYNLSGKYKYGILTMLFVVFLSNGFGFVQLATFAAPEITNDLSSSLNLEYPLTCCTNPSEGFGNLKTFPVWSSTRIIPNTINEFPYASFLFGELHPHSLSLPFQLLFILVLANIFFSSDKLTLSKKNLPKLLLISLVLGSLFFINSWDYPIYLGLFFLVFITKYVKDSKNKLREFIPFVSTIILSIILYSSFFFSEKRDLTFGLVNEVTSLPHFIILFPLFIFTALYYIWKREGKELLVSIVASFILSLGVNIPILTVIMPIIYFSGKSILKNNEQLLSILLLTGGLIALFTEIFFIDSRFNNIFKFHYNLWVIWSIATAYTIYKLKDKLFKYIVIFLIIASLPMSIFGTYDRLDDGVFTLDGLDYMKNRNPDDYAAINWINENIEKGIILEAPGDAFQYSSIVSTNTGLPTVIGWSNHELVRRGIFFIERIDDVNEIYSTENLDNAMKLISKYNVKYVYIGNEEKTKYPSNGLIKFEQLDKIYDNDGIKIFQVSK